MPHRPANGLALTQNSELKHPFLRSHSVLAPPQAFSFPVSHVKSGRSSSLFFFFWKFFISKAITSKRLRVHPLRQPRACNPTCRWAGWLSMTSNENREHYVKARGSPTCEQESVRHLWPRAVVLKIKGQSMLQWVQGQPTGPKKKKKFYWRILLCTYIWTVREHFCLWSQLNQSLGIFIWLCSIATFPMISRWQFTWGWPHTSCAQKWGGTSIQTAQVFKFSDKWDLFSKHS